MEIGCNFLPPPSFFIFREFEKASKEFRKMRNQPLDTSKATLLKEEGNEMYKSGQIQEAIKLYTQALTICPPAIPLKDQITRLLQVMPNWWDGVCKPLH